VFVAVSSIRVEHFFSPWLWPITIRPELFPAGENKRERLVFVEGKFYKQLISPVRRLLENKYPCITL
jgi:hypothetical protein